jgi:pimeloyl-ACP methyl ester carboxylesterase
MAGGFAMPKEPGTDRFAARFHAAGFSVLAFDFRRLGGSGGRPRQVVRIREQLADWQAAIAAAAALPEVDPARIAVWSFSATGGEVFQVAAGNSQLAAAIAQTPNVDGPATSRNAARYQTPTAMLRFTVRGLRDALGGLIGRPPVLVPLVGTPGTVAVLTMPDALDGDRALHAERYPGWRQVVAARSALRLTLYSPGRTAADVRCPLLVVVAEQDRAALAEPAIRAAGRAPAAELLLVPGGHYAPFLDQHERVVDAELAFLRRHLLDTSTADRSARSHADRPAAVGPTD